MAQGSQRLPGRGGIGDVEHLVDQCPARQPLRFGQVSLGALMAAAQQAVQLQGGLFLPVQLQQFIDQGLLLVVLPDPVGQVQIECIAGIEGGAGHAEEQPQLARQPTEEMTGPDIRVQADADFRHRQPAAWRDNAHPSPLQQAHAAAQHVAVGPAQQRLGVGVQVIIEGVFGGEEARGNWRYAAWPLATGVGQRPHIAACAKGLGAIATQQHTDHIGVMGPGAQLDVEGFDHAQGQGIERLGGVERGNADAGAVSACENLALKGHGIPRTDGRCSMAGRTEYAGYRSDE